VVIDNVRPYSLDLQLSATALSFNAQEKADPIGLGHDQSWIRGRGTAIMLHPLVVSHPPSSLPCQVWAMNGWHANWTPKLGPKEREQRMVIVN
jgi:hypothetical protein